MELVVRVPEAVRDHRVDERHVVNPDPPAGLFYEVRRAAHRLHATRKEDLRRSRLDHVRSEHHGLQAGPADLVDRHGADPVRKPPEDRRLAGRVLAEARGNHVAHEDLLDVRRDEPCAVHRLGDDRATELDRLDIAEGATVFANGSATGARENDIGQVETPTN